LDDRHETRLKAWPEALTRKGFIPTGPSSIGTP
jgi:hypothetical protein